MSAVVIEPENSPWHALDVDHILGKLQTSASSGITEAEAARRISVHGPNALPEQKRTSTLVLFLNQFRSPLIYLLIAAAAIAYFMGETSDALVILFVVVLNSIIGAMHERRAAQALEALQKLSAIKVRVKREGTEQVLNSRDLVPGDILLLSAGDAVPADARLIEAVSFQCAEAALTGESLPVSKAVKVLPEDTALADRANMTYSGTHVTSGRGQAVVVATGLSTEVGKIAKLTTGAEEPQTPLERRIEQFGRYLIFAALGLFALIVGVGYLQGLPFSTIFMIGISQIVSMIPEGLPVAVTVALAVGVQRMASRRAIVRKLAAVEALGSTSVICTDKTGTLTRNEMTVREIMLPGEPLIQVTGGGYSFEGEVFYAETKEKTQPKEGDTFKSLLNVAVLCNDSEVKNSEILGDPTEAALLVLAQKAGVTPSKLRKELPRRAEIPFDSSAKMMATEHRLQAEKIVYLKGAPEAVLRLSGPEGAEKSETVRRCADEMAARSLRVLAFAEVVGATIDPAKGFEQFAGRVRILGLVGQMDPPRDEAYAAVAECRSAGIRPVMVTGDHKATAQAIGGMLGIFRPGDEAVDGRELEQLSQDELDARMDRISVFARVYPEQKLRIVEALQRRGHVVAMTGDGVNDAPALARADVGVAMGITGTDVAKEASKIVITDDNFATIVHAVAEGRLIYRNIKKLILYLFATGVSEIIVLLTALLLGYPPPLLAVMILWVNLVTDGALSVTLIMEGPEGDEMRERPTPLKEPIITRPMLHRWAFMAPSIATSTLGYFIFRLNSGDMSLDEVRTGTFTVLVVAQWFNALNCRSDKHSAFTLDILRNRWFLGGLLIANVLQACIIFIPTLNEVFHTTPIPLEEAILIGAVASLVLWVEELRKWVVRRREKSAAAKREMG